MRLSAIAGSVALEMDRNLDLGWASARSAESSTLCAHGQHRACPRRSWPVAPSSPRSSFAPRECSAPAMALYKYGPYLTNSDASAFDATYSSGQTPPHSGIYRCTGCGREITAEHAPVAPAAEPPSAHPYAGCGHVATHRLRRSRAQVEGQRRSAFVTYRVKGIASGARALTEDCACAFGDLAFVECRGGRSWRASAIS
jgi:hypothetical protein